jgi:hypothetical protein
VARQRPVKKSVPPAAAERRVLPMELQLGDRLTDETGEWGIVGRPYTTNGAKDAHARVRKVGQPDVPQLRTWRAHERISVKRATTEEGKRRCDCAGLQRSPHSAARLRAPTHVRRRAPLAAAGLGKLALVV